MFRPSGRVDDTAARIVGCLSVAPVQGGAGSRSIENAQCLAGAGQMLADQLCVQGVQALGGACLLGQALPVLARGCVRSLGLQPSQHGLFVVGVRFSGNAGQACRRQRIQCFNNGSFFLLDHGQWRRVGMFECFLLAFEKLGEAPQLGAFLFEQALNRHAVLRRNADGSPCRVPFRPVALQSRRH